MTDKLRQHLMHFVMSLLLSAGLIGPVLGFLLPSWSVSLAAVCMLAVVLVFEVLSLSRKTAFVGALLIEAGLCVWLFSGGGLTVITDLLRGLSLRFSGIESALPLIGRSMTVFVSVLLSLISCVFLLPALSLLIMPVMALCTGVLMMIWLTDSPHLLPWFLPALAVLLVLIMTERFAETSRARVLPCAAVLVLLAYLIARLLGGSVSYAPLKEKADEWRQSVMDRLFFTEPRDVFSLASEGYYPQGTGQLGGKPDPDDHVVMQVSSPRTAYLRGVVMDWYDGHAWRNTTGGRRYLWQSRRYDQERTLLFDQLLPVSAVQNSMSEPRDVSVRMLSDSASTLFVPQRIRDIKPGGELVPYFSNASEIFITRNLQASDTYSVSAPLYQAGDPGLGTLIAVCADFDDPGYDSAVRTYTSLPDHLEAPVWTLAADVVAASHTPYDQALALQNWLRRSCRYTLDVEEHPVNLDFVTRFLLTTKEGYCTYFASAMTVLCRMVGLPARFVEGYVAVPDETGQAVVTGMNAHAWTEVYFRGFGWLTFDATPVRESGNSRGGENPSDPPSDPETTPTATPSPTPTPSPEAAPSDEPDPSETPPPDEQTPSPAPSDSPSDQPENEPSQEPSSAPESPEPSQPPVSSADHASRWLLWLLLILVIALALRIILTSPAVLDRRSRDEESRYMVWIHETARLLTAAGFIRRSGESPLAFARRVDESGVFSADLIPVGESLSLMRYAGVQPAASDTQLIRDTASMIAGALPSNARLRYWLNRVFVPARKKDTL